MFEGAGYYSLGNRSKDRQRFVDAIVLISAADWSKTLSNFENVVFTAFESAFKHRTTLGFAKLITFLEIFLSDKNLSRIFVTQ